MNGFGWKANETVAAQIVSVPMAVPIQIAHVAFRTLVIYLIVGLVLSLVAIDAAVVLLVIRPVRKLSDMADRISTGDMSLPELPVYGRDEIAGSYRVVQPDVREPAEGVPPVERLSDARGMLPRNCSRLLAELISCASV